MLDDAAGVPAENFIGGKFEFDAWLGEELSMGSIVRVERDEDSWRSADNGNQGAARCQNLEVLP